MGQQRPPVFSVDRDWPDATTVGIGICVCPAIDGELLFESYWTETGSFEKDDPCCVPAPIDQHRDFGCGGIAVLVSEHGPRIYLYVRS